MVVRCLAMDSVWFIILLLHFNGHFVAPLNLERCSTALGMQSGRIPDTAITASSSHDEKTVGPKSSRIRTEYKGGAWCHLGLIDKDSYEFLQIDLGALYVVTAAEIQGRFGNGHGKEYAEHFLLEYQREDGGKWMRFRNKLGDEMFKGNENTYLAELRQVSPPIIGRRIRFIPYSKRSRSVCMRVEVYGCLWEDGVISYSVRQGDKRGAEIDLYDFTYDGKIDDNFLQGGLGQLMDGETGVANFRLDPQGLGIKGYEWVGWRNDSDVSSGYIEIVFKFDTVRNFSAVILNCNNYFSKEVRIFKRSMVLFSIGGKSFNSDPLWYESAPDNGMELNRDVEMNLKHSIGKFVKMRLYFESKWILLSEIRFMSEAEEDGNYTEETPTPPTTPVPVKTTETSPVTIVFTHGYNFKNGSHQTVAEDSSKDEDIISIIIGALAALIVVLSLIVVIIIIRHKRHKNSNRQSLRPVDASFTVDLNNYHNSMNGKVSNGTVYNGVATEDLDTVAKSNHNEHKSLPELTSAHANNLMVVLPQTKDQEQPLIKAQRKTSTQSLDKPPNYDALYAAADVVRSQTPNVVEMQGVSGNNVYAVPNVELLQGIETSTTEFPRRNLRFVEVLGEGQFGEVHLCEAVGISEFTPCDFTVNRRASSPVLVAVKILRVNADERARNDFHREIKVMSMLKDPNIVRVLGVCTTEEPICMIVEYMKYGDLNQFLLDHVPEGPNTGVNARTISYGCQIYMASQIASGMKYLESLNMVHRDLATRNCLVGSYYTIKISDFGMSRSLYSSDYYRIEGRAVLPIRWMAWESILLGKFTTRSDVWSFAVTLWEILTLAREQPFEGMVDEEVIENAGHYYRNDDKQLYLPHPPICPKEIYDLMRECWNRQESERPSFREIHMFLLRKNMGYDPKEDINVTDTTIVTVC